MGLLDRCVEKMNGTGMERITQRYDGEMGKGIIVKEGPGQDAPKTLFQKYEESGDYSSCEEGYYAIERLAEYEDTGITPEQICKISEMYRGLATEHGKYKKAEEQGLLLKLPVNPETQIYSIEYCCGENKSNKMGMCHRGRCKECESRSYYIHEATAEASCKICEIGKSVFLTQEEAEAALVKMEVPE